MKGKPILIDFENDIKRISEKNEEVRCENCKHLLLKKDDKFIHILHKGISLVMYEVKKLSIKCPMCKNIVKIK